MAMIKKPDIPPTMNSETSEETLLRLQQERDGFLREKEEQDIKDVELEQKLKILGEKLGIKPETQESSDTENKKTAEQILDESKERAKIESEIKDKLEAQKAKIEIRKSFLSPAKKLLFEKLSKAGNFIGTNWDKLKETQGFQKGAAGLSAYSQFMNGGKEIFRFQNGIDKDGNPTYYRYTWRKLALSSAIAGTAVAFLPVTGVAAASVFGTKIARGIIGGIGGAKAIKEINREGQEKISKLEMEKGNTNLTEEQLVSLEKKIRRTKLATQAFAMTAGIVTGYALAILAGEITGRIGSTNLETPGIKNPTVPNNETQFTNTGRTLGGGDRVWDKNKVSIWGQFKNLFGGHNEKPEEVIFDNDEVTTEIVIENKGGATDSTEVNTPKEKILIEKTVEKVEENKEDATDSTEVNTPEKEVVSGETEKTTIEKVDDNKESASDSTKVVTPQEEIVKAKENIIPKEALIDSEHNVGVTYAFKSQLEANHELATKMGYPLEGTASEKALFLKHLGEKTGYIGPDGQVLVKANVGAAYELKIDTNGKIMVQEYQNGVATEIHHEGDKLETGKDLNEYEYSKATIPAEKLEYGGIENEGTDLEEGDDKYKIDGPQKNLDGTLLTDEGDYAIEGDQKDLPDIDKTEIEKPFIIDPIWEKPTKLGVDYYLHGNDHLKGLDKNTLDALLKQGIVIDRQTVTPLGVIHNYEMKGAGEILKLRDDAELIKAKFHLKANALNTDPLGTETMEEYKERLIKSMDKIEKEQQNIKIDLSQQSNAIDYEKGRKDGFYDAAYAQAEHRYKVMRNGQITNGFLNLIFRNNRYYGGYNSGYYNSNGGYYR